jgi:hypothetical protein
MDQPVYLQLIYEARQRCRNAYSYIDPMSAGLRQTRNQIFDAGGRPDIDELMVGINPIRSAVVKLVSTPRTLKHVLRRFDECWSTLHGEIDFDDLFVCCVLRFGVPEAFNFLLRTIGELRKGESFPASESGRRDEAKRKELVQRNWQAAVEGMSRQSESARALVTFLFPDGGVEFSGGHYLQRICPQGVRHYSPTDYWRRLLAEELEPSEIRDQEVLKNMQDWEESPTTSDLAKRMQSSDEFGAVWEHFAETTNVPDLPGLATQLCSLVLRSNGAHASMERGQADGSALIRVWRRANRTLEQDDSTRQWLTEQVRRAVPTSLRLANDLYYYFASRKYGVVRPADRDQIRQQFLEVVKRSFPKENPSLLVASIDRSYPYLLRHLVVPPGDIEDGKSKFSDPSAWQWFAPVIVAAAELSPDAVAPQVMCLFGEVDHGMGGTANVQFDSVAVENMFGNLTQRLMNVLSGYNAAADTAQPTVGLPSGFFEILRDHARHWLQEQRR